MKSDAVMDTLGEQKPIIPLGSMVLVTAANGLIASHASDQLLATGYRVRGTVRNLNKNSWMLSLFSDRYGPGRFELAEIPDITAPRVWDECMKGVSAVAHTVSTLTFAVGDLDETLENELPLHLSLLEAARSANVKSVAMISSAWAAYTPDVSRSLTVTEASWNDEAVKLAWDRGEPLEKKGMSRFMALKTMVEKETWKWVDEKEPSFTFNTLLIDTVMGESVDPKHQGLRSTAAMVCWPWEGQGIGMMNMMQPQWHFDAGDSGRLFVAALTLPGVDRERLFGFGARYSWFRVARILKDLYPEKEIADGLVNLGWDQTDVPPRKRAEALLQRLGQGGFTTLEQSVKAAAKSWIASNES